MRRFVMLVVVAAAFMALTMGQAFAGPDQSWNSCNSKAAYKSDLKVGYCPGISQSQRP